MKKVFFVAAMLFAIATSSFAQDGERVFKKFKGEVALGYGYFPGSDIKNGLIYSLEPKYALSDQLCIGGLYEVGFQYKQVTTTDFYNNSDTKDILKLNLAFSFTTDYYFSKDFSARPFIGAGLGVHVINTDNITSDYYQSDDDSNTKVAFGCLARGGVEIKHFRISLAYNFVSNTKRTYRAYNTVLFAYDDYTQIYKNSYIALKLGASFGGGPKKRDRKHRN